MAVPSAAAWLGAGGLVPFVGLAALAHLGPEGGAALAGDMLAIYGVAILSFLGGCRWGFASAGLGEGPTMRPLAIAVVPAIYAAAVPPVGLPVGFLLLAAGFAVLLAGDIVLTRERGAPAWWPRLRWPLTLGAVASLLAAAAA